MSTNNLVILRGRVSSEPQQRELPSGSSIVQIDLTTDVDGVATSVPVVDESGRSQATAGDQLVVIGHVRRRFFRASGTTQSRTEVIAAQIVPASRKGAVQRAIQRAIERAIDLA